METAAIFRNTVESWRGSAVRRLLTDLTARVSAETSPRARTTARDTHGGDTFWEARGQATTPSRRRQINWFEQAELWNSEDRQVASAAAVPVREPAAAVRDEDDEPAFEHTRRERLDAFSMQQKSVRMADIAKFLQVNHAVDGLDVDASRFSLPHRSFAARFSLWKGTPVGTPFLTGC